MEYQGKLYGKVAGKCLPLTKTTEDIDKLRRQRDELIKLLEPFAMMHCTAPESCTCHNCNAHNFIANIKVTP